MNDPIVFIIDDDPSALRGLARLVRAAGFKVETFTSAGDFLAFGKLNGPGCIVLDVRMPEMSGPELQEELDKAEYSMPIVFLSAHADVETTVETMKKGAVDFLTKPVDRDDLLESIRASLAMDAENRARRAESSAVQDLLHTLTPRQHEVMTHVIAGMRNKQIAVGLGISEETVKIHRGRMMQRLGIRSVAELVRLCEKAGIAPADPRRS